MRKPRRQCRQQLSKHENAAYEQGVMISDFIDDFITTTSHICNICTMQLNADRIWPPELFVCCCPRRSGQWSRATCERQRQSSRCTREGSAPPHRAVRCHGHRPWPHSRVHVGPTPCQRPVSRRAKRAPSRWRGHREFGSF